MKRSDTTSRFLPYEKYTIHTRLSEEEVVKRLQSIIEYRNPFTLNIFKTASAYRSYEGKISEKTFKMSRIISYRNSFLPVIKGTVSTYLDKTEVAVSMQLVLFVKIFIIFWLTATGIVALGVSIVILTALFQLNFNKLSFALLIPIGMFFFGYLLTLLAFKGEAKKSREELDTLLEAEKPIYEMN